MTEKKPKQTVNSEVRGVETPEKPAEPREAIASKSKWPEQIKISVSLDVSGFQSVLEQVYNDGRLSGFWDGVKYIVTLAEKFLVQHEKLSGREALSKDSTLMPTWWIATLVEALYYKPPYTPMPEKSREKSALRLIKKEEGGNEEPTGQDTG